MEPISLGCPTRPMGVRDRMEFILPLSLATFIRTSVIILQQHREPEGGMQLTAYIQPAGRQNTIMGWHMMCGSIKYSDILFSLLELEASLSQH